MKRTRSLSILITSVIGLAILFAFQNCGDVNLSAKTGSVVLGGTGSPESPPTFLKIPDAPDMEMKAVFIVDVSSSMTSVSCSEDIDENLASNDCLDGRTGADPTAQRMKIIEHWVNEIEAYLQTRNYPANRFQAIFIPFSGPDPNRKLITELQSPRVLPNIPEQFHTYQLNFSLGTPANIRNITKSYKRLQAYKMNIPGDPSQIVGTLPTGQDSPVRNLAMAIMRTSNPQPGIRAARQYIAQELQTLSQTPGKLEKTRFEIVFMSDGVPKPNRKVMKSMIEFVWDTRKLWRPLRWYPTNNCIYSGLQACQFEEEDYSASGLNCNAILGPYMDQILFQAQESSFVFNSASFGGRAYYPPEIENNVNKARCMDALFDYGSDLENDRQIAKSLFEDARYYLGDYTQNVPTQILAQIKQIERLFSQYSAAQFRMNFIRFENPQGFPHALPADLDKSINWMTAAADHYLNNSRFLVVKSNSVTPFSLFPGTSRSDSYKLAHLFAINSQARVSADGSLAMDSDGDGLLDLEENSTTGFSPTVARKNGICLDSITHFYKGCFNDGCDPKLDRDGDSLNECEERTLTTSDFDFDSDNDSIPDLYEVLFRFNPKKDDSKEDYNGDGVSNLQNFKHGLGPWTNPGSVDPAIMSRISFRTTGTKSVVVDGRALTILEYVIQLLSLPRVFSLGSEVNYPLYSDREHQSAHATLLAGAASPMNTNRVMFLGRVDNILNAGDSYWILKNENLPYSLEPLSVSIDLGTFQTPKFTDPTGGGQ